MLRDGERLREVQESPPDKKAPPNWLFALSLPVAASYFIWMGYMTVQFSEEYVTKSTKYAGYPLQLRFGWISGRKMDLTDPQWDMFRQFLPLLVIAAVCFTSASTSVKNYICKVNL
jgi:hypothetical protein